MVVKGQYVKLTLEESYKHSYKENYVYIGNSTFENDTICKNCGEVLIKRKYFSVLENRVIDGICPKCKTKLDGVFL